LIIQIEEKAAMEDLDGILSVPGVDVALIGPNDLSIALGLAGQIDHPVLQAAMEQVVEVAARHGVASGIHLRDLALLRVWKEKGMRFLMYANEVILLRQAAEQAAKAVRGG
jgi:2-keto-3-deoxy-L-rhamnonate aldolase RhmA